MQLYHTTYQSGQDHKGRGQAAWAGILILTFSNRVTLATLINFSVPWFSQLENEDTTKQYCCEDWMTLHFSKDNL